MRKFLTIWLTGILTLGMLTGCKGQPSGGEKGQAQEAIQKQETAQKQEAASKEEAKAADSKETYEMVIALHTNDGTIEDQAIDRFAEAVNEKSGGRMKVTVFPGATIGTEEENLEQIGSNEIQGSIFGDVMTSQLAADLDPTVTPFLFSSIDDVLAVWDGDVGQRINEACMENGNLRVIGVGRRGARYLLANKEITSPDQVKGLKLRLPSIANWVTIWESLGTLATPISFSEVYTSLQTGVVDAFESTAELTDSGSYYDVVSYAMDTHHLYGLFHLAVCESWLEALPEDLQKMVIEEGEAACQWGDEQMADYEAEMVQSLKDHGMTVVEVDNQAFKEAAMPAIDGIVEKWQDGVWDSIREYVE